MSSLCFRPKLGQKQPTPKANSTSRSECENLLHSISLKFLTKSSSLSPATKDSYSQRLSAIFSNLDSLCSGPQDTNDDTHQDLVSEWFELSDQFYTDAKWEGTVVSAETVKGIEELLALGVELGLISKDSSGDEGQIAVADDHRLMEEAQREFDRAMVAIEEGAFEWVVEEDSSAAE